jgi:predicted porin
LNQSDYVETYSEWLPALTVQRAFPVNDSLVVVIANQVDYHFSYVPTSTNSSSFTTSTGSSQVNNRFDEAVSLTVSWQVNRQLYVQPYARYQYSRYRMCPSFFQTSGLGNGLDNNLYSVGVTLTYYFNQNVSARTFYNYNMKHSNDPSAAGYSESESGVGAALNFTF